MTIEPRRGVYVAKVSVSDLEDLNFMRSVIEGELCFAIPTSPADHNTLQNLTTEMHHATDT